MSSWKQIAAAKAVLGRETGTIVKDHGGKLTVALAYPNTYGVGMASLALQILYRLFNARADVVCERVFWDEAAIAAGQPLLSLETSRPIAEFDVWAFTVSFEMDYFHVAAMLRQAGVEPPGLTTEDHGGRPFLLAGGPALSMNPEPLAPFFDAILIGEAEEALPRLIDMLVEGIAEDRDRRDNVDGDASRPLLDALGREAGIYLPSRVPAGAGWAADRPALGAQCRGIAACVRALYARRRVSQPPPDRDRARLRPRVPLLPGRLCLPPAPGATASSGSCNGHATLWRCNCRSTRTGALQACSRHRLAWSRLPCRITRISTNSQRSCS